LAGGTFHSVKEGMRFSNSASVPAISGVAADGTK
jgi:hypothetical protein